MLPMEKEVTEIKIRPLKNQVTALIDEHLDTRLGATKDEFMNFLSASLTTRIAEQVKNQLHQILSKEVSNFAPPVIESLRSKKDKDEDLSTGSYRWLKKRNTSKDAGLATSPRAKESQFGSSKGDKSQSKSSRKSVQSEEPEFEVTD
ncbi:hypothetical protein Tco_0934964 [Tanacetum coccineum]